MIAFSAGMLYFQVLNIGYQIAELKSQSLDIRRQFSLSPPMTQKQQDQIMKIRDDLMRIKIEMENAIRMGMLQTPEQKKEQFDRWLDERLKRSNPFRWEPSDERGRRWYQQDIEEYRYKVQ
jgi:hypothetical protein